MTTLPVLRSEHESEIRRLRYEISSLERKLEYVERQLGSLRSESGRKVDDIWRKLDDDATARALFRFVLGCVLIFVVAMRTM